MNSQRNFAPSHCNINWEAQFNDITRLLEKSEISSQNNDLFSEFENIWKNIELNQLEERFGDEESVQPTLPTLDYQFEKDNPFLNDSDPVALGLWHAQNNSLSEACLAFEAGVQQNPQDAATWCLLGLTQAQNEKEESAIAALQNSYKLDSTDLTCIMVNVFVTKRPWLSVIQMKAMMSK